MTNHLLRRGLILLLGSAAVASAGAQGPSPVRYTEAREYAVRRAIILPGSVESRVNSVVASEVAGLVTELLTREGTAVEEGQPIARLRTTNLELQRDSAAAQLKEAEARLKQAEVNLARATELLEAKVISKQDYDDRFYEYNAWKGRVDSLTAEIARIQDNIDRSSICAPFAGVVTAERTEVGQWVDRGDPVVELLAVNDLEVRVDVPEQYYDSLKLGVPARVTFESLPGLEVQGRVSAIIPQADFQARTFPLKVRIPNRGGRIGVGMLAQVSFPGKESYQATVVPKDAVIIRGQERIVYLLNGDNTVSPVNVETGTGVGAWIEIRGPVQPGQKVVTRGNERLQPGQQVQGEPLRYELP